MRGLGSARFQVNSVLEELKEFGQSKHEAKNEFREEYREKNNDENPTWRDIAQNTGIYTAGYADDIRKTAMDMFQYAKDEFKIRDVRMIEPQHVASWFEQKICDQENRVNSIGTIDTYGSHLIKFSVGLEQLTGQKYDWTGVIDEAKAMGREVLEPRDSDRAYTDPWAIVDHMPQSHHFDTAAAMQAEMGLRIGEIHEFHQHDDGTYHVIGKGGYEREVFPSPELANQIAEATKDGPLLATQNLQNQYSSALHVACEAVGEKYTGSHGFRHSFAIRQYENCLENGLTHPQSCRAVSEMLGHHREDVVEKYYLR